MIQSRRSYDMEADISSLAALISDPARGRILIALLDGRSLPATELAQRAGITKQAISQLVRELEVRGYVEQVPDLTDTRAKIVRLTKRGVALHAAVAEVRLELQAIALAKLGKSRVSRLRRDLIELAAALEEDAHALKT